MVINLEAMKTDMVFESHTNTANSPFSVDKNQCNLFVSDTFVAENNIFKNFSYQFTQKEITKTVGGDEGMMGLISQSF